MSNFQPYRLTSPPRVFLEDEHSASKPAPTGRFAETGVCTCFLVSLSRRQGPSPVYCLLQRNFAEACLDYDKSPATFYGSDDCIRWSCSPLTGFHNLGLIHLRGASPSGHPKGVIPCGRKAAFPFYTVMQRFSLLRASRRTLGSAPCGPEYHTPQVAMHSSISARGRSINIPMSCGRRCPARR